MQVLICDFEQEFHQKVTAREYFKQEFDLEEETCLRECHLDQRMGEGCALEVHWMEPFPQDGGVQYMPTFEMYQALGELKSNKEME